MLALIVRCFASERMQYCVGLGQTVRGTQRSETIFSPFLNLESLKFLLWFGHVFHTFKSQGVADHKQADRQEHDAL